MAIEIQAFERLVTIMIGNERSNWHLYEILMKER